MTERKGAPHSGNTAVSIRIEKGEMAIAEGLEPSTRCLEGSCSIQLSYATAETFLCLPA